jgi:hypothetical protein
MRSFVARADPNFEGFSRLHGADSAAGQYAPMDPIMALLRLNVRFGGAHLGRTQYLPINCTDCYVTTLRIDAWFTTSSYANMMGIRRSGLTTGAERTAGIGRPISRSGVAPN